MQKGKPVVLPSASRPRRLLAAPVTLSRGSSLAPTKLDAFKRRSAHLHAFVNRTGRPPRVRGLDDVCSSARHIQHRPARALFRRQDTALAPSPRLRPRPDLGYVSTSPACPRARTFSSRLSAETARRLVHSDHLRRAALALHHFQGVVSAFRALLPEESSVPMPKRCSRRSRRPKRARMLDLAAYLSSSATAVAVRPVRTVLPVSSASRPPHVLSHGANRAFTHSLHPDKLVWWPVFTASRRIKMML